MLKRILLLVMFFVFTAGDCIADIAPSEMYCTEMDFGATCSVWTGYEENAESVPVCVTSSCGLPDCSVETCNWTLDGDNLGCKEMSVQEVNEITDGEWVEGYSASGTYEGPFAWVNYLIYEHTLMATVYGILGRGALEVDGVYECPTWENCRFTEIFKIPYYNFPVFVKWRKWETGDKFW